jgi:hypothetical protein
MVMKYFFFYSVILFLLVFPHSARSQNESFGLGILVGEPTGITAKYWLSQTTALDGAFAWSFSHSGSLYLHADYLNHHFDIIDIPDGRMPIYYGVGAKLVFASEGIFGVHAPIGMAYLFEDAPLEIFIEIRPGLNILPSLSFDISGGIGVRYYFNQ